PVFWIFSGVVTEHFGNVTANHFAVFANELDLTSARLLRGKKIMKCALIQSPLRSDCVRSATLKETAK
ncbi:hypothetical protein MLM10_025835, partial [Escherichia coli]|nr:hypothetical protein [Escherichia coli]